MKAKHRESEWVIVGAVFLLALMSRIVYTSVYEELYDDAFITFRFAENIAAGQGFSYNPGVPVYGASSPLYTLVIAGLRVAATPDVIPPFSRWIGITALFGCSLLLYRHLSISPVARMVVVILLLSYPRIFYASVGGMEECILLFLMAVSVMGLARGSPALFGVAIGLLFITKIDTIIWILCTLGVAALRRQRFLWFSIGIGCAVSLPWIVYSLIAFGTILPHTILAKQVAYAHESGLRLLDVFLLAVPDGLRESLPMALLFGSFWYGILAISLGTAVRSRAWLFLVFPLYCVAYTGALLLSGTSLGLWVRWTVPFWGCLIVCLGYLVDSALRRSRPGWSSLSGRVRSIALMGACIVLLLAPFVYPNRSALAISSHIQTGRWLVTHSSSGQSVLLEPIGVIGYLSNAYVHDFIGLVSPQITQARLEHERSNRWFVAYVKRHAPTYIVLRAIELARNEFLYGGYGDGIFMEDEREWFERHYSIAFRSGEGSTNDTFLVFKAVGP